MKNLKKRIISIFLVLVMVLTMLPADMGADTAKAADTTGSLSFTYRYGTDSLIQVNTNLPSDTLCASFTADQNGCSIDQSGNTVQWVGWIGMDNVDGTIVLSFHFNSAFTASQTYVLPKGAIFGFTDSNTYALDGDYTFTFDGSAWTMTVENQVVIPEELTFELRGGTDTYIQVNTNLPSTTLLKDFLATDNGCNIDQTANTTHNFGYASMANADGTIVITFNFGTAFTAGQNWIVGQGSVFGFTDGNTYPLDKTYTFTWDGSSWAMMAELAPVEFSMTYRGGGATYVQTNTTIPTGLVYDATNSNIIYESTNTVSSLSVIDTGTEQVISVSYGAACETGDVITIEKGSKFAFTDSSVYVLDRTWKFTYDGTTWESMAETSVLSASGANNYLQPILNAPSTESGIALSHNLDETGGTLTSSNIASYNNSDGNALVSVSFTTNATAGDTYCWQKGSTVTIDGVTYYLDATYKFTYDGSTWSVTTIEYVNAEATLSPSGVYGSVIQFGGFYDLGVPADNTKFDFAGTVKLDGVEIQDNVDFWFGGYAGIDTISFNCNIDFVDKLLTIEEGTVLSYNDTYVTITKTFNGIWDGSAWTMVPVIVAEKELVQGYTANTLVQFNEFYDFGVPSDNTSLTFDGTALLDGVKVEKPDFVGYPSNTTICLQNISHQNKVLTIMAGSVISYNGVGVKVSKTFNMMYNGTSWTEIDYIYSEVEGDANGDVNVDSIDLIRLKKVVDSVKEPNNQCDLDSNEKYNGVDVHYLRLIILYGSISNLDVLDPLLYMGGEDFVTFADLPVDATDTAKIEEFKALGFNTSLLTQDHASTSYSVSMSKPETAEIQLESEEKLLTLEYAGYTNGSLIQIKTNLPSDAECYTTSGGAFSLGQYGHELDMYSDSEVWYFQLSYDANSNMVYFNPVFKTYCDNGDKYILKAGTKLNIDGVYYVLDRTYTFTMQNEYLASIQNLDNAGLNVWIRNYSNQAGYFTTDLTDLLALHKDKIDGFYIVDEPFMTQELYEYSKQEYSSSEITDSFENISSDLVPWFNTNYADTYFHINHVPMSSYNHYGTKGDTEAEPAKYATFFDTYVTNILANVSTSNEKKTIGYDSYPFGYAEDEEYLWGLITQTEFYTTGIAPNYLVNMLIPAQKAKANGVTFSTCIQTFDNTYDSKTREITTAAEVSFQLYTAMACGADMFEYFVYNSFDDGSTSFNGILDINGNQTELYNEVKTANANAFSFADVINVFDWQGAQVSSGSSTNKNATGIATAQNAGLELLLDDSTNGVLSSVSSDDDAVVGYYTKGTQAGYMVANYNDPKVVTTNNTVTFTFEDCTKARVYTSVDGKLTSEVVTLTNGSYTQEVAPGGAFFIIPAN